jgi:hypothetical protein
VCKGIWCREQDLNLHAFGALDPKSSASANSAIPARILGLQRIISIDGNETFECGVVFKDGQRISQG